MVKVAAEVPVPDGNVLPARRRHTVEGAAPTTPLEPTLKVPETTEEVHHTLALNENTMTEIQFFHGRLEATIVTVTTTTTTTITSIGEGTMRYSPTKG